MVDSIKEAGFAGKIEDDNIFDSEWRWKCLAYCLRCGKAIGQKISIPKERSEGRHLVRHPKPTDKEVEMHMALRLWENHGKDCPRRIIVVGGNA